MIFDVNNLLFYTGSSYAFTSGNFRSLVGTTESGLASSTISLGAAEDLGIGDGDAIPKVALTIGTGVTTANTTATITFQFQGSTDSTNWTTYAQSAALTTASLTAGSTPFMIDVPPVPTGVSLPSYYRVNIALSNTGGTQTISAGTIIGGLVIQRDNNNVGSYASNFTVV